MQLKYCLVSPLVQHKIIEPWHGPLFPGGGGRVGAGYMLRLQHAACFSVGVCINHRGLGQIHLVRFDKISQGTAVFPVVMVQGPPPSAQCWSILHAQSILYTALSHDLPTITSEYTTVPYFLYIATFIIPSIGVVQCNLVHNIA